MWRARGLSGSALVFGLSACSASHPATPAPAPAITAVSVVANPSCVLSATLTFTTSVPTTAHAHVANRGAGANAFDTPTETAPSTTHALPLLGMRALSDFAITVTATDAGGRSASATASFQTPALPASLPPVTVVSNDTSRAAPGYLVLDVFEYSGGPIAVASAASSAIVALDADLQVVWYEVGIFDDPEKLPSGNYIAIQDPGAAVAEPLWLELDMMGSTVKKYSAAQIGIDSLSHAATPEDSGVFLGLSTALQYVDGYPAPDGSPTVTYPVVGTVILELTYDGGFTELANTFNFFDPLDEGNPTLFASGSSWSNRFYPDAGATKDWIHTNAIGPDPSDDTIVASSRTQSWIYKVRRDGTLAWRLGAGGDFTLTNPGESWEYGQHGAYVTPSGTIMCFDNGFDRPLPAGVALYSRALELSLDTQSMAATIVWQYRGDGFYSEAFGSSYFLPGGAGGRGTVLVDDGLELARPTGSFTDPSNLKHARVMEVTHDASPSLVLEVDLDVPLGGFAPDPAYSGFTVYRAYKWPSLY